MNQNNPVEPNKQARHLLTIILKILILILHHRKKLKIQEIPYSDLKRFQLNNKLNRLHYRNLNRRNRDWLRGKRAIFKKKTHSLLKIENNYKIKSLLLNWPKKANTHLKKTYKIWPILIKMIKKKSRMNIQNKIVKSKIIYFKVKKEVVKKTSIIWIKLKKTRQSVIQKERDLILICLHPFMKERCKYQAWIHLMVHLLRVLVVEDFLKLRKEIQWNAKN